jgi:hypothetical protein
MTERGWPLIPREVLPAPVRRAKMPLAPRPAPPEGDTGRQLSMFGAETTEPSPADLAGLLAGPGRLGRMGGTARVTVRVDAAWRVHALVAELVSRGLVVSWAPIEDDVRQPAHPVDEAVIVAAETPVTRTFDPDADPTPDLPSDVESARPAEARLAEARLAGVPPAEVEPAEGPPVQPVRSEESTAWQSDESDVNLEADTPEEPAPPARPRFEVRTAYSSRLNGLARAWPDAAAQLFLSGPRLRLWAAAAGEPVAGGYALGLDPAQDPSVIDAALVRAGLAGRVSQDGRRYVITGRRRLKRLAELVGERPEAAPEDLWPGSAGA